MRIAIALTLGLASLAGGAEAGGSIRNPFPQSLDYRFQCDAVRYRVKAATVTRTHWRFTALEIDGRSIARDDMAVANRALGRFFLLDRIAIGCGETGDILSIEGLRQEDIIRHANAPEPKPDDAKPYSVILTFRGRRLLEMGDPSVTD